MHQRLKGIDRGVLYMLLASLLFAFMGAFAKSLSGKMPSIEIVFFRNIFGVLLIAATVWSIPMRHKGGRPFLLFFRGFIGFAALLAFFYNIAHIPLADAMTFSKTSPIFTAIFAFLFLREKLSLSGWAALFIGFIGIVLITDSTALHFDRYDLLGIFSGVGAALAYTSVRELKKYYDTRAIVLSFMLVGTVGPLLLMVATPLLELPEIGAASAGLRGWDFLLGTFVMPQGVMWLEVIAMGLFATSAQVYMTRAYGVSKAGVVGAISYANIPFSIIVGLFLGDGFPSLWIITGIVLIVASGIIIAQEKPPQ